MKKLILVAFAVLASMAATVASQTAPAVDEVRISHAIPRFELPQELRNVWPDEFEQVVGTYYLSNGKNMQLSTWGNRMYAKIDGMPRAQLVAVSPYEFVALDKKMKISIDDRQNSGRINAQILLITSRVVSNTAVDEVTHLIANR